MDWTQIIVAMLVTAPATIAAISAAITAWKVSKKVDIVHEQINSRMEQLLTSTAQVKLAEGVAKGVQQEMDRTKSPGEKS